jgi:putative component of toxin-antitoxin plasmid stabilization module
LRFELSPATRRVAALGLLLVVAALLWSLIGAPMLDAQRQARSTIERLQPLLQRAGTIESDITALEAEINQIKEHVGSPNGFLDGVNESIAAAELQSRLKRVVEGASGDLRSVQVLPAQDDDGYRRVTVRGQILISLAALQRVLYDLEASQPYLFLDNVAIADRPDNRSPNAAAEDAVLDVRFDVFGYMRKTL